MKKVFFVFCFSVFVFCLNAQVNLVPNPSFENIISCDSTGLGSVCNGQVPPWNCSQGSTDLYNTCSTYTPCSIPFNYGGFQNPHTFNGYIGLATYSTAILNYRETAQVRLDSTLKLNRKYCINFFVNLSDSSAYAVNNMGMYISDSLLDSSTSIFNYTSQVNCSTIITDTLNWTLISGEYIAHGGEKYIIIGNFFPDSLTNTVIFNHNTLIPYPSAYYYIDDVSIIDCTGLGVEELNNPYHISLSPNPNDGIMQLNYSLNDKDNAVLEIYNLLGEKFNTYILQTTSNLLKIEENNLSSGLYFYKIIVNGKMVKSDKIIISK